MKRKEEVKPQASFRVRYAHVIDAKAVSKHEHAVNLNNAKSDALHTMKHKPPKTVSMIDVEQRFSNHWELIHRWTKKGKQWKRVR